ncbi:MAG: ZPR1 zinc finger domain-containing protein [Promethearchaeota archaeon]
MENNGTKVENKKKDKNNDKSIIPLDKKPGNYDLPELPDNILCPICKKGNLKFQRTLYTLPDGEEILIFVTSCSNKDCGYMNRDIITLNTKFRPGRYILKVKNGDLSHKIFRGPNAKIILPEADFEIEPGTASSYIITNIEGIIDRMINWTQYMIKNRMENEMGLVNIKKMKDVLNILMKIKNKEMNFTLILEDPIGGSYIILSDESSKQEDKDHSILSFEELKKD